MVKTVEFQRGSATVRKVFCVGLCCAAIAAATLAHGANAGLTAATADRMTRACFAYASAHRAAVNIWIYDRDGDVIRYERMDGAPAIGSVPGSLPPGRTLRPFGSAIDPNSLAPADPGDVAIDASGENLGRVRVAGMGPAGDRACAEAAVAAAK
jgi:uncharacterized protein GlcG (DUF336 family)